MTSFWKELWKDDENQGSNHFCGRPINIRYRTWHEHLSWWTPLSRSLVFKSTQSVCVFLWEQLMSCQLNVFQHLQALAVRDYRPTRSSRCVSRPLNARDQPHEANSRRRPRQNISMMSTLSTPTRMYRSSLQSSLHPFSLPPPAPQQPPLHHRTCSVLSMPLPLEPPKETLGAMSMPQEDGFFKSKPRLASSTRCIRWILQHHICHSFTTNAWLSAQSRISCNCLWNQLFLALFHFARNFVVSSPPATGPGCPSSPTSNINVTSMRIVTRNTFTAASLGTSDHMYHHVFDDNLCHQAGRLEIYFTFSRESRRDPYRQWFHWSSMWPTELPSANCTCVLPRGRYNTVSENSTTSLFHAIRPAGSLPNVNKCYTDSHRHKAIVAVTLCVANSTKPLPWKSRQLFPQEQPPRHVNWPSQTLLVSSATVPMGYRQTSSPRCCDPAKTNCERVFTSRGCITSLARNCSCKELSASCGPINSGMPPSFTMRTWSNPTTPNASCPWSLTMCGEDKPRPVTQIIRDIVRCNLIRARLTRALYCFHPMQFRMLSATLSFSSNGITSSMYWNRIAVSRWHSPWNGRMSKSTS